MNIKSYLKIIFLTSITTTHIVSYADEASIFCSNKNRNWHWLNNGITKVKGKWVSSQNNQNQYFTYFILDGGEEKYLKLREICQFSFGNDYIFPQPGRLYDYAWSVFGTKDKTFDGYYNIINIEIPIAIGLYY
ncbi:hypothetical protein [Silvanigrella aquatica]|uniref:Uncharacterized protein n=1 Tax=Silvanigrella aquatica TaxID=1915309 RepID=A0A1L4CYS7_9BACT|nr:hypothetical protein [Silvanigrella aquatica]APJ03109.1 hypothetical protein AXG55_03975 [Silvanigrella aquatica]